MRLRVRACTTVCVCVWKNASVSVVKADKFPDVLKCVQSLKLKDWGLKIQVI